MEIDSFKTTMDSSTQRLLNEKLFKAIKNGDIAIVNELLLSRANTDFIDSFGFTALILALWYKHNEIAKVLLTFGANIDKPNSKFSLSILIGVIKGIIGLITFSIKNRGKNYGN